MCSVLKNHNIKETNVFRDENHVTKNNSADLDQSSNNNSKESIRAPDSSFQLLL